MLDTLARLADAGAAGADGAGAPPELLADDGNGLPEFGCDGFWFSGCS
jgi:hypothetical protein